MICCRSNKNISNRTEIQSVHSSNSLISGLTSTPSFTFFKAKGKLNYSDKYQNHKATLYIKGIRDSLLWFSVKKFSSEFGRGIITQDSITFIDRFNKCYTTYPLDELEQIYGIKIDFSLMESLVYGYPSSIDTLSIHYKKKIEGQQLHIRTNHDQLLLELALDLYTGHLQHGNIISQIEREAIYDYADYIELDDNVFLPGKRKYKFILNAYDSIEIAIDLSKIEIDEVEDINTHIPQHYTRN